MNKEVSLGTSISIDAISLHNCTFRREADIDFAAATQSVKFDVSSIPDIESGKCITTITANYKLLDGDMEKATLDMTIIGKFSVEKGSNIDLTKFGKTTAANYVYIFLREELTRMTASAGLMPLVLRPIDFTLLEEKS